MIALVSGTVAVRRGDHVVVDCGGVGYRLAVSAETLRHVPGGRQGRCSLHTHLVVRDDALAAVRIRHRGGARAVPDAARRSSRSGPKVALAVLSGGPPRELLSGARRRRHRAPPGGPGRRQADGRADHRRAAREGRRDRCPSRRRSPISAAPRRPARARARRPARARLQPGEVDELLDGAERRAARGPDRPRAEDGPAMSPVREMHDERRAIQDPEELPDDDLDRSLRPRRLEDFVGQEAIKDQLAVSIAAAASRGEALDHVLLAGPPGPRQDLAGPDRRRRARGPVRADRRPGARAQGRRRRVPDRARAARGVLRRRDPPAAARARGDVLSGDGGRRRCRSRSARARARAS